MLARNLAYVALAAALLAFCALVPASAQVAPPPLNSITVLGRGIVRIPADRMRVVVHITGRSNASGASMNIDDAGKTIAEALRAHGMPDAAWVLPLSGFLGPGGNAPQIVGTIEKPTRARAEAIMRDTLTALPDALAAVVQSAQVQSTLFATDCSVAEARAQKLALADARRRAAAAARAAGVRLGNVLIVNENSFPPASCNAPTDYGMTGYNSQQGISFDPYGAPEIAILVAATVSYRIR